MKILIAYDGSPLAEACLDEVISRPWPEGAVARIVTVAEPPFIGATPPGVETETVSLAEIRAAIERHAQQINQHARERVAQATGLPVDGEVRKGRAKDAILEAVREWRPDLALAGSQATLAERLFLGSVSHALVTHAPCNVMIIKKVRETAPVRRAGGDRRRADAPRRRR